MVGRCASGMTKTTYGEIRIERKSRLHCCPRLLQLSEQCQSTGQREVRERNGSVRFKSPSIPSDCFAVIRLAAGNHHAPRSGVGVARRKSERLVDVSLSFCTSAKLILG